MRILGATASGYSPVSVDYSSLVAPSTQLTTAIGTSATNPSGFMSGNGYYVKYGGNAAGALNGYIEYSTSLTSPSWSTKLIQSVGQARGINYIDTGTNKYWVYGQDFNGNFYYTTDGTPNGALTTITPNSAGTSATMLMYCPGAARPFVAVGGSTTTGIYVYTATTINGTYTSATHASQSGSVSVQGIAWGGTGTGSDKRLIFVCGGNGAGATYFSAANDTTSYTVQTVTGGDCRGIAYTGTHWLYLGDNQFGRAPASSFNNTTGNVITYGNPVGYPGTVRGVAATPDQSGVCYLSGNSAVLYSTDHGATWAAATTAITISSHAKMHIGPDAIVAYSNAAAPIVYRMYA